MKTAIASIVGAGLLISASAAGGEGSWDHNDIDAWASLPDSVCGLGQVQSPINFNTSSEWPAAKESLVLNYPSSIDAMVSNNGFSPQLNFPEGEAYVTLDGEKFELLQIHFHAPSEETFDGVAPALDSHLVHQNPETKQLLVIGVTFNEGKENNALLDLAVENDPTAESETKNPVAGVPLASYVPDAPMYTFDGSLTTPPCSEGVLWFVSQKIASATASEIDALKSVAESQGLKTGTARPTQPLNGRSIETITPEKSVMSADMESVASSNGLVQNFKAVAIASLAMLAVF